MLSILLRRFPFRIREEVFKRIANGHRLIECKMTGFYNGNIGIIGGDAVPDEQQDESTDNRQDIANLLRFTFLYRRGGLRSSRGRFCCCSRL